MARIGTKKPMSVTTRAEVGRELDRLSKAALIDLYTCALSRVIESGQFHRSPTLEDVAKDAIPLLKMRGDRVPRSLKESEPDPFTWPASPKTLTTVGGHNAS